MISDDADEDADTLDDDATFETLLGGDTPKTETAAGPPLPEWPPAIARNLNLRIEADVLAWFKTTHPDWRGAMAAVLRGWVASHTNDNSTGP